MTEEIINKLLDTDRMGWTSWNVYAWWKKLHLLQGIWEWAKENLTTEEIEKLRGTDGEGETVWHVAADRGKLDIAENVGVF